MRMKRIVIVTNSLTGGGAERAMNLISNALSQDGHHVTLLAINKSAFDLIRNECSVITLDRENNSGMIGTALALRAFVKSVMRIKPDVYFINCDLPELFACFLPFKSNIVVIEHANPAWSTRKNFGKIVRQILRFRDVTFVAVSSHLRIWPTNFAPEWILPNIIPISQRVNFISERHSQIQRLVFIGRLARVQKRPDWILDIAKIAMLPTKFIGSGAELDSLKIKAGELEVDAEFSGHILDPWKELSDGDLLIVPSSFEGDGLVILEAISNRIPFLVSDISDFRRFHLQEEVYCKNIEDFVDRISLYSNRLDELIVPIDVAARILDSRDIHKVLEKWNSLLSKFV
jgi:glycosyltransferase involved in cell wall biosynthesis